MSEVSISDARSRLSDVVERARLAPVYITRRNRPVAVVVDVHVLNGLLEDAEELADIRAVDDAWAETERLAETSIPWEHVKRDLGLIP